MAYPELLEIVYFRGEQTANEGTHQLETHGGRVQVREGVAVLLRIITRTKLMDKMMVAVRG